MVENSRKALGRSSVVLLLVGLVSSLGVYAGHEWFHGRFLPMLGLNAALGDALGGFVIILIAFLGQRLASMAFFRDTEFGLIKAAEQLQHDNAEVRRELGEMDRIASIDRLTGCWNRRRLEETVRGEMDRLKRYDNALSLLVFDIDHFKNVNDMHGHQVGDQVLTELAQRMRTTLRTTDSLTRWGGEEFVVLCPNTPLATAIMLAERLREKIAAQAFDGVGAITISLGVAECLPREAWREWFARADAALYRAKAGGRNQVQFAAESPDSSDAGAPRITQFVKIGWHHSYASGHPAIDREHQILFRTANDLLNAIIAKRPDEEIRIIIGKLVEEITRHFENEEAVLAQIGYPGLVEHAELHRNLLQRTATLIDTLQSGSCEVGEVFQYLVHDVVARHMLGADRDYFTHLTARQAQATTS